MKPQSPTKKLNKEWRFGILFTSYFQWWATVQKSIQLAFKECNIKVTGLLCVIVFVNTWTGTSVWKFDSISSCWGSIAAGQEANMETYKNTEYLVKPFGINMQRLTNRACPLVVLLFFYFSFSVLSIQNKQSIFMHSVCSHSHFVYLYSLRYTLFIRT